MSISIKATKAFQTTDGQVHSDRKVAVKHESALARKKALSALNFVFPPDMKVDDREAGVDGNGFLVADSDLVQFIVDNGDAILVALTVKQARGPSGPRVPK